jgi:hypothetical protein
MDSLGLAGKESILFSFKKEDVKIMNFDTEILTKSGLGFFMGISAGLQLSGIIFLSFLHQLPLISIPTLETTY